MQWSRSLSVTMLNTAAPSSETCGNGPTGAHDRLPAFECFLPNLNRMVTSNSCRHRLHRQRRPEGSFKCRQGRRGRCAISGRLAQCSSLLGTLLVPCAQFKLHHFELIVRSAINAVFFSFCHRHRFICLYPVVRFIEKKYL